MRVVQSIMWASGVDEWQNGLCGALHFKGYGIKGTVHVGKLNGCVQCLRCKYKNCFHNTMRHRTPCAMSRFRLLIQDASTMHVPVMTSPAGFSGFFALFGGCVVLLRHSTSISFTFENEYSSAVAIVVISEKR
jgi:hypothetical protein